MSTRVSTSGPRLELSSGAEKFSAAASGARAGPHATSPVAEPPSDQQSAPDTNIEQSGDAPPKPPSHSTSRKPASSGLIRYRIEFVGRESGSYSFEHKPEQLDVSEEPLVFEYVEVRLSSQAVISSSTKDEQDITRTDKGKGRAYINILSPAVAEALRCVVDYFPGLDLSGNVIKIPEPYSPFVFFEEELSAYRERAEKLAKDESSTCPNRWAAKHIGLVQDFVREQVQDRVDAERERHARGYATFDMLWLLYKPGADVYFDFHEVGEHEPYVVGKFDFDLVNGATNSYEAGFWNIDADSHWVAPKGIRHTIHRFGGEKKIPSLNAFPCQYLRFSDGVGEEDALAIRQHFVNRGRKWYNLRRQVRCCYFDGFTTTFPRRPVSTSAARLWPFHLPD